MKKGVILGGIVILGALATAKAVQAHGIPGIGGNGIPPDLINEDTTDYIKVWKEGSDYHIHYYEHVNNRLQDAVQNPSFPVRDLFDLWLTNGHITNTQYTNANAQLDILG